MPKKATAPHLPLSQLTRQEILGVLETHVRIWPTRLEHTHTCQVTHLPIPLQLTTEEGGGTVDKELLYGV